VAVLGLVLTACSDRSGTAPNQSTRFDAATLEANVAAMERISSTPVLVSFAALGSHLGSAGVAVPPATSEAGLAAAGRVARLVSRIAGLVGPGTNAQLVPIIRSSVLGKTFVYDSATKRYVVDPARTGAPANGVRFILYQIDPATKEPKPGVETGYADLIDEEASSTTSLGLRLRVVSQGTTYLEYAFEVSGQVVSPTLAVNGYLTDGTDRLNFQLTASGQLIGNGGAIRLDARLEVPSHQFSVTATVQGIGGGGNGDGQVDLTVRSGTDVIVVAGKVQGGQLDASFRVNGALLATATGDPKSPVIRGQDGRELTAEEVKALQQIVGLTEGIFKLFYGLLEPVAALLGLGLGVGG